MKSFFKIFFIFIVLLVSICLNPQVDSYSAVNSSEIITNNSQKVYLVSNTIRGGEIFAETENSSPISFGNNHNFVPANCNKNEFKNLQSRYNREIIHRISTSLKTEISIRAP